MIILLIFLFIFGLFLYFLPTKIASSNNLSPSLAGWVLVINLLLGWTIIGWLIALLLALYGKNSKE